MVRAEDADHAAYEVWTSPANVRQLWDALIAAGAAPVGSNALEMQRIASGIPRYGVDIRERDLPQETEQARALNFNKGCYVGQEIVERIRSRGAVHRKFTGFLAEDAGPIAAGTKVVAEKKKWARSPVPRTCSSRKGIRRWRWATSGARSAFPGTR